MEIRRKTGNGQILLLSDNFDEITERGGGGARQIMRTVLSLLLLLIGVLQIEITTPLGSEKRAVKLCALMTDS